ncbi:MAG: hypothetical protein A2545_05800 [Planctomycetes bacterium RIFOXYD2_FULL_41_16]|nr:MAG: hypothetical protein A2545_05800 [Planctomycetes bacterium RIFOXYD2_FULL_41_16]
MVHTCYLFIVVLVTTGWLQMIKIITFIIGVERTHGWFLIVYLTQGEALFIVGKMLTFQRRMATPAAPQTISFSTCYRMVNFPFIEDIVNPSPCLKQKGRTENIYPLCYLLNPLQDSNLFYFKLVDELCHDFLPFFIKDTCPHENGEM